MEGVGSLGCLRLFCSPACLLAGEVRLSRRVLLGSLARRPTGAALQGSMLKRTALFSPRLPASPRRMTGEDKPCRSKRLGLF